MTKPKIVAVVGPTASGKSALAIRLAKKFHGEIVSADSRQVYRGLDIGTAKVSKRERDRVPHHLIDVTRPQTAFNAVDFSERAGRTIREIQNRHRIPIVVGGSGFWIDTLLRGLNLPKVRPNPGLRRQLEKKTPAELLALLKKLDLRRSKTVEPKNPRRLIRAIEIAKTLGRVPKLTEKPGGEVLWLGLFPKPRGLKNRIASRTQKMIRRGLLAETRALLQKKIPRRRIREFGFEYRAALECLENKISKTELARRLNRETLDYARRQMAWFARNHRIHWLDRPLQNRTAEHLIKDFLAAHPSGKTP